MSGINQSNDHEAITQSSATTSNLEGVVSLRDRNPTVVKRDELSEDSIDSEQGEKTVDFKQRQEFQGLSLFWLAWQATGVIYGDIGTSPLYVYSSTFTSDPSYDDLLGAVSLIIWSLTLIVTIKYVLIVLRFDDEGEGGTFALYTLLSRYANITKRQINELSTIKMDRYDTNELSTPIKGVRTWLEKSRIAKVILKVLAVFGVSLIMADGLLTPAQSVLGAIQGIQVINPSIQGGTVIGISCGIIILLFLIQPFGTSKLATGFAPVVVIWLLFNAIVGIYNLVLYDHSVLKAFSPYFAGAFLVRNGQDGWKMLGGILLAFTGVEALFADLGAFSRNAISLSWCFFAYPCLLLAYIGQAAFISETPSAYSNPFFNCVPPGTLYFSLIIAVLAAIVASQALVTATFQLLSQIMKLSYFPQIKVVHTSRKFHGQIYIPLANWLLMIGTVIVTAVYSNTTNLGNAYGVCVILVTFITTCIVTLSALIVSRVSPFIAIPSFIIFAALDGAFLSSALTKIPNGAWFTLLLAAILSSIFVLWRWGKEQQWAAEAGDRVTFSELISISKTDDSISLTPDFGSTRLTQIDGLAIFFDKIGDPRTVPHIYTQYVTKFVSIPQVSVFLHLRPLSRPAINPEDSFTFSETGLPNTYHLIIRYGYTDEIITEDLGLLIVTQLKSALSTHSIIRSRRTTCPQHNLHTLPQHSPPLQQPTQYGPASPESKSNPSDLIRPIDTAYNNQVLYILGKEQMRIRPGTNVFRWVMLGMFMWLRENTRGKMASLKLAGDGLVEVGFIKNI